MFGFLHPVPASRDYRRCYARLCQFQHLHYGFWSLPFHSYEATFLFAAAVDGGAIPMGAIPDRTCCKFMTRQSLRNGPEAEVGRFCASFALLLTAIKIQDDLRDSRGLLARFAGWILRRRLDDAQRYFQRFDSRFAQNVSQLIRDHHELEARREPIDLEEYTVPTSNAFGYLFGLMSHLRGMGSHRDSLIQVGREVGASLILFDCATDYHRDRKRGEFNPLPDAESIDDAYRRSAAHLDQASRLTGRTFGEGALTTRVLVQVRERILRRGCCVPRVPISPWKVIGSQVGRSAKLFALALSPVMASKSRPKKEEEDYELVPDEPGSSEPLDELTEEEKAKLRDPDEEQKKRRNASPDCCDGCMCFGYSCQCAGEGGCQAAGCCEGAECGAVCA